MIVAFLLSTQYRTILSTCLNANESRSGLDFKIAVRVRGDDGKSHELLRSINPGPGTGYAKGFILNSGRLSVLPIHYFSRCNGLVGVILMGSKVSYDDDLNTKLFQRLPTRFQMKTVEDNVRVVSARGSVLKLNFMTRQERDGVMATYRLKNGKLNLVSAKYWRDSSWNAVRTF